MDQLPPWRRKVYTIVYESDTPAGQLFDILILVAILLSILVVMLDTVGWFSKVYQEELYLLEWFFTLLFTGEYLVRIFVVGKPSRYLLSFYGIIDILSILPTYISIMVPGTQFLLTIRTLRLLRVFRILKLTRFLGEGKSLMKALRSSAPKIILFIGAVTILSIILGTIMYMVEGPENGFSSIPKSIYWSIVTLTTVGYGDIAPQTILGQTIATLIMILGYGIIAVPTGIVSVELARPSNAKEERFVCVNCQNDQHLPGASYCHQCGHALPVD